MFHKCDGCQFKGEHQEMMFKPMGICKKGADLVEALKFYEAEKCPFNETKSMCDVNAYCQADCESCKLADELRKKQDLDEALENMKQVLGELFQPLYDTIHQMVENLAKMFGVTIPKVIELARKISSYPNKKVVHLAFHHPKARVRKKNLNRIKKWIDRK